MWDLPKNTQKGIMALEDKNTETVYDARYGTFLDFKKVILKNIDDPKGIIKKADDLDKYLDMGAMDDLEGINFWATMRFNNSPKSYTFFWFQKDSGPAVCPTAKLSQYFKEYAPFLKKNSAKKPATKSPAKKPVAKKTVKR